MRLFNIIWVFVFFFISPWVYAGGGSGGGVDRPSGKPVITLHNIENGATDTNGSYKLSWTAVDYATSYSVFENGSRVHNNSTREKSFSGKSNGSYEYKIAGTNSHGVSDVAIVTITVNKPPADYHKIVGTVDDVNGNDEVVGWTCAKDHSASISYHVYVGGPAGSGTKIGQGSASLNSESQVADACRTSGSKHRFKFKLTESMKIAHGGKAVYVHGISPFGLPNYSISGGGAHTVPIAKPAVPGAMTVPSSSSTGNYTVSSGTAARAVTYEIWENTNGGAFQKKQSTSSRSYTPPKKSNGTYGYKAKACNTVGCSAFNSAKYITVNIPPAIPGVPGKPYFQYTFNSSQDDNGAYTVKWNAPTSGGSVDRYELSENNGSAVNVTSNSKAFSGKANNTSYNYKVRACNAGGCSSWSSVSSTLSIKLRPPMPGAFTQCTDTVIANANADFAWGAATYATQYELRRALSGSSSYTTVYSGSSSSTSKSVPAGTYNFEVRACNGSSICSAYRTGCTVTSVVDGNAVFTYENVEKQNQTPYIDTDGNFTLHWNSFGGDNFPYYYLYEKINSGGYSNTPIALGYGANSKAYTNKSSGSRYRYQIRACKETPFGLNKIIRDCTMPKESAEILIQIPPPIPNVPQQPGFLDTLSGTLDDDGFYTVRWLAPIGGGSVSNYELSENDGTPVVVNDTSKDYSKADGTSFNYKVRACNSSGCSDWSTVSTTLMIRIRPAVPGSFTSCPSPVVANAQVDLVWGASTAYATRYELRRAPAGSTSYTTVYNDAQASATLPVTSGHYDFQVRACNGNDNVMCSGYQTGCTINAVQDTTATFTYENVEVQDPYVDTNGSYTLRWNDFGGDNFSYYYLYESINGGSYGVTPIELGYGTNFKSYSNKPSGNTYRYQIRACSLTPFSMNKIMRDCTAPKESAVIQIKYLPPAPVWETCPATSAQSSVAITWSNIGLADHYVWQEQSAGVWGNEQTSSVRSVNITAGNSARVKACHVGGCSAYSTVCTVATNAKPSISFQSPEDMQWYRPSQSDIALKVNASDSDGSIAKVRFFVNGSEAPQSSVSNTGNIYEYHPPQRDVAYYQWYAIAEDNYGATISLAASARTYRIIDEFDQAPTHISPLHNGVIEVDSDNNPCWTFNAVTPAASEYELVVAPQSDFAIGYWRIKLAPTQTTTMTQCWNQGVNWQAINGAGNPPAALQHNQTFYWQSSASLYENGELKRYSVNPTIDAFKINELIEPQVSLLAPDDGAVISEGYTEISLQAQANDTDGVISSVAFYVNEQQVVYLPGQVLDDTYIHGLTNYPLGKYSWYAIAIDNDGLAVQSDTRNFSIIGNMAGPALLSPDNGAAVLDTPILPLTLSWSEAVSATHYQLQISPDEMFTNYWMTSEIASSGAASYSFAWDSTALSSSNENILPVPDRLEKSQTYYWKVVALKRDAGNLLDSGESETRSVYVLLDDKTPYISAQITSQLAPASIHTFVAGDFEFGDPDDIDLLGTFIFKAVAQLDSNNNPIAPEGYLLNTDGSTQVTALEGDSITVPVTVTDADGNESAPFMANYLIAAQPADALMELCTAANPADCIEFNAVNPADDVPLGETLIPVIPGNLSVSSLGVANYSVALDVPPGIRGVEPKLSINYSHQGGNGLLGKGWSLGGLSSIERCNKTWTQDGKLAGTNDDHDYALCLDGARLITINNLEWEPAGDSTVKVIGTGQHKNPDNFIVYQADGSKAYYGNSSDSYWAGDNRSDAFSWRIKEVQDIFGNSMTFHYQNNPSQDVYRIQSISYGFEAGLNLSVEFVTQARPDKRTVYAVGVPRKQDQRLQSVQMKIGNTIVHRYDLSYEQTSIDPAQISYLNQIQKCAGSDCQTTQFNWTQEGASDYQAGVAENWSQGWSINDQFVDVNQDGLMDLVKYRLVKLRDASAGSTEPDAYEVHEIRLAKKVNGQIVYAAEAGKWDIEHPEYRFFGAADGNTYSLVNFYYNQLRDMNGDGYPDLVSLQNDFRASNYESLNNNRGLHIAYSDGQGSFIYTHNPYGKTQSLYQATSLYGGGALTFNGYIPNQERRSVSLQDVNADGFPDIIISGATWRPGTNFGPKMDAAPDYNVVLGAIDIERMNRNLLQLDATAPTIPNIYSPTNDAPANITFDSGWFHENEATWRDHVSYRDLNGDGYLDILKHGNSLSYNDDGNLEVRFIRQERVDGDINFVDGWALRPETQNGNVCKHQYLGDVNGDGLADLVAQCNPGSQVIINTGERGVSLAEWPDTSTAGSQGFSMYLNPNDPHMKDTTQLLDINGDGMDDLLSWDIGSDPNNPKLNSVITVRFSTGQGFAAPIAWTPEIPVGYRVPGIVTPGTGGIPYAFAPRFADFNGDGMLDVAGVHGNQVFINPIKQRKLESISQKMGGAQSVETEIRYKNLVDNDENNGNGIGGYHSTQTLASGGAEGEIMAAQVRVPHAKWVVDQVHTDNGIGGKNIERHDYYGLKMHRYHGSLGFAKKSVTNELGYRSDTYYSQDYEHSLVGSVIKTQTFAPNGELIKEIENHYAVECLNGSAEDCFRNEHTLDAMAQSNATVSTHIVPHIRVSMLSQNTQSWTINSDNSVTHISNSRMSMIEADSLDCNGNWNIPVDHVNVFDQTNPRGNHDGYGRSLHQETIVCDAINTGTYKKTSADKTYEQHPNIATGEWLNGLETSTTTTQTGYQADGFAGGFNAAMASRSNSTTVNYYQGAIGSATPKGAVHSTTSEAGTEGEVTTTITYDARGEVSSSVQSFGNSSDLSGLPGINSITTTAVTSYVPGVNGYKQVISTDAMGQTVSSRNDNIFGAVVYGQDSAGIESFITLDNYGRPIQSIVKANYQSLNTTTRYQLCGSCEQAGNKAVAMVHSKTDGQSPVRAYQDILGRNVAGKTLGINGQPIWTFTEYDQYGRTVKTSLPWNANKAGEPKQYTTFTYDSEGRVKTETAPDGGGKINTYNGLAITGTNALGQSQTNTQNALGLLIKAEDESGSFVTYRYNAAGLMVETHMNGHDQSAPVITTLTYDNRGNRIGITDPNTGAWHYQYNALGLLSRQSDALNNKITMDYDKLGRMIKRYDNGAQSGDWTYNNKGQLTKTKINSGSDTTQNYLSQIDYNPWGLPTSQALSLDGATYNTQTFYDNYNRPSAIVYPSLTDNAGRLVIQTDYTAYGQPGRINNAVSKQSYWQAGTELDSLGKLINGLYGNGVSTNYGYDPQSGRLLNTNSQHQGQDILRQSFAYNKLGNLLSRHDEHLGVHENFKYDDLNRLTHAHIGIGAQKFEYDSLGNIIAKRSHANENKIYQYGQSNNAGPHAVSSITDNGITSSYHYDAAGQLTQVSGNSATTQNQWTAFGKPWQMSKTQNGITSSNTVLYSPDRKRYKREDHSSQGDRTTYYINGIFEAITGQDANGQVLPSQFKHYIGDVAVFTYSPSITARKLTYRHTDHIGSLIAETEHVAANQALADTQIHRYRFDPWGKRINADGSQLAQDDLGKPFNANKGFTGHEMLEESGLVHMNGRVYDPSIARFLSPDPLVQAPDFTQSFNRYTYVWNNPLSLTDPTGFMADEGGPPGGAGGMDDPYGACGIPGSPCNKDDEYQQIKDEFKKFVEIQDACKRGMGAKCRAALKKYGITKGSASDSGDAGSVLEGGKEGAFNASIGDYMKEHANHVDLAIEMYYGMCVNGNKCKKGQLNYFGASSEEKKTVEAAVLMLETLSVAYNTAEMKKLIDSIKNSEHPVIIAFRPGTNKAIPISRSREKGGPVVIFLDPETKNVVQGSVPNRANTYDLPIPFAEVLAHEFKHAYELTTGEARMNTSGPEKFGTDRQWEIDVIEWMNSNRKLWQRKSYSGSRE